MSRYKIYGLGNALVDTEIEVTDAQLIEQNVEKGLMTLVDQARQEHLSEALRENLTYAKRASGGSACNSMIAASYFGAPTWYSCKVADDKDGEFFLNDLSQAGVAYDRHKEFPSGSTGRCLVMITPNAERSMNTFLGISESLSTDELNEDAIADSEWVYIEGYLVTSPTGRAAAIELANIARKNGRKVAITLSDPGIVEFFGSGLKEMIGEGVDLIFCNLDEAMAFTQSESLSDAIEGLKQYSKESVITLGAEGAVVTDGDCLVEIQPFNVDPVDTNGAGDMFAGAYLAGISSGLSIKDAGRLASRSSAQVVAQFGPRLKPKQHREILEELNLSL